MQIIFYAGALVFKQDATLKEFWEHELEPFYHFIPVNADLTDLVEKVCVCLGVCMCVGGWVCVCLGARTRALLSLHTSQRWAHRFSRKGVCVYGIIEYEQTRRTHLHRENTFMPWVPPPRTIIVYKQKTRAFEQHGALLIFSLFFFFSSEDWVGSRKRRRGESNCTKW